MNGNLATGYSWEDFPSKTTQRTCQKTCEKYGKTEKTWAIFQHF